MTSTSTSFRRVWFCCDTALEGFFRYGRDPRVACSLVCYHLSARSFSQVSSHLSLASQANASWFTRSWRFLKIGINSLFVSLQRQRIEKLRIQFLKLMYPRFF